MGDSFKRLDAASYRGHAAAFNELSERYSGAFADAMAEFAEIPQCARVLDLGCGAGVVGRGALRARPDAWVAGADLSREMLVQAGAAGMSELFQSDAESLCLGREKFDVILSMFLIRHLREPWRALTCCHEALSAGGTVVFGIGGGPLRLSWAGGIDAAKRLGLLASAKLTGRLEAPSMLIGLMDQMGLPEIDRDRVDGNRLSNSALLRLFEEAGFSRIETRWVGKDFRISSREEFWRLQTTFSTHIRKRLSLVDEAALGQLKREFVVRCERSNAGLHYPCGVLMIRAQR